LRQNEKNETGLFKGYAKLDHIRNSGIKTKLKTA
jgi:hypothetical protein